MTNLDYLPEVATVPFPLGQPEDLPFTVAAVVAAAHRAEPAGRLFAEPAVRGSLRRLVNAARAVRTELGEVPAEPVGPTPVESTANRDNDLAFGIVRVRAEAVPMLVDATLRALIGALELAERDGVEIDPGHWNRLTHGFDAMLSWLAAPARPPVPRPVAEPGSDAPPREQDALRRWVRGHHVFMVFAQGLTMTGGCLHDCWQRGDLTPAVAVARTATALMWGSEGALAFAGASSADEYVAEIRRTLMPPVAPPKMSGLHWRDHEALIWQLERAGPVWEWLGGAHPEVLHEFRAAMDAAYVAHARVCSSFVGDQSPSLLATSRSSRPAVGVLEQFRRLRLDLLPAVPAGRPSATSPEEGTP